MRLEKSFLLSIVSRHPSKRTLDFAAGIILCKKSTKAKIFTIWPIIWRGPDPWHPIGYFRDLCRTLSREPRFFWSKKRSYHRTVKSSSSDSDFKGISGNAKPLPCPLLDDSWWKKLEPNGFIISFPYPRKCSASKRIIKFRVFHPEADRTFCPEKFFYFNWIVICLNPKARCAHSFQLILWLLFSACATQRH